jgi:hypothetical protein
MRARGMASLKDMAHRVFDAVLGVTDRVPDAR